MIRMRPASSAARRNNRRRRRRTYCCRHRQCYCRPRHHRRRHVCSGSVKHQLLDSIAREEMALARLINAEAKKTQRLAHTMHGPFMPDEVIAFQHSVAKVLERAAHKEQLLLNKLRLVMTMREPGHFHAHCLEDINE